MQENATFFKRGIMALAIAVIGSAAIFVGCSKKSDDAKAVDTSVTVKVKTSKF